MRKSDGGYTYFVPDVAYHVTKWERGFTTAINVQGSDHHSTITRVRAGLQATGLGIPPGYPDYVLHKMVTVMKGGEEVKISKRAGSYVTLRELIDEVGRDAVRFFLVSRKAESEFTFDIDLARSQTLDNPVYYVQYANARVASVMRQAGIAPGEAAAALRDADLAPLASPFEDALLRRLAAFPAELALAARELAPHLVTTYLKELAAEFHSYYNAERFLVDDPATQRARLALAAATGQVVQQRARRAGHQRAGSDVIATRLSRRNRAMTSRTDHRAPRAADREAPLRPVAQVRLRRNAARHVHRRRAGPGARCRRRVLSDEGGQPVSVRRARAGAAARGGEGPGQGPGGPKPAPRRSRASISTRSCRAWRSRRSSRRAPIAARADKATADRAASPDKAVAKVDERPAPPAADKAAKAAERFWLQAGSFANEADAENLKARLAFAGWEAAIQSASLPDKGVRFRVRLGPYDNTDELTRMKGELAKRGFDVAVIKF